MSIEIMSMVFKASVPNLKAKKINRKGTAASLVITAPTLKLLLLSLADHVNDEGEGAYPAITTLETKTGLSRPSVINGLTALEQSGLITKSGKSRFGTNAYNLSKPLIHSLILSKNSQPALLVNQVDSASKAALPALVNQVDSASKAALPDSSIHPNTSFNLAPEAGGNGRMKSRQPGGTDAIKKGDIVTGLLAFQQPPSGVDFSWLDEYLIPRALAFWQETKIEPMPDERSFWRKELRAQYEAGITAEQIKTACQRMRQDGLTIKSPASIRAVAKDIQANPPAEPKLLPELPPARIGTPMPAEIRARLNAILASDPEIPELEEMENPDEMPTL